MAKISDRLKASIGDGKITSLFPVVRFFKDITIGDSINDVAYANTFNVSIKDVNLEALAGIKTRTILRIARV